MSFFFGVVLRGGEGIKKSISEGSKKKYKIVEKKEVDQKLDRLF